MFRTRLRIATTLSALTLLAACAPAAPPPQSGGAAPAPPAKTVEQAIVIGMSSMQPVLDPQLQLGDNGRRYDIFDCLLLPNEKGEPQAAIATAWKMLDQLTWQFTLRTDMKWHDGTPLTADDVKYSFDRVLDPANKLAAVARLVTIDTATVVDKATVNIKTKTPDPILLRRLDQAAIVPKAYVEKVGPTEFGLKPIGSGPFKVKEFKTGDTLVLTAFDEHAFRKPTLREVTMKQIPEAAARVAGLRTGALDYVEKITIDQATQLKTEGFDVISLATGSSLGFFMDSVYNDKPIDAPSADKRVRQAINYAIDKDAIVKQIYQGFTKPEGQVAQPETVGYNPDVKPYPYDVAKAKSLLAEAGYPNGFKLKAEFGAASQTLALFIQQGLKDVGIDLELNVLSDPAVAREKIYNIQPRLPLNAASLNNSPAMDADFSLNWFWSGNVTNRHYNNPEFDKAYEASRTETDPAKRQTLLRQALLIMHDDPPYVFIAPNPVLFAYSAKKLQGVAVTVEVDQRLDKIQRIS